jgi:hypothetical protein
MVSLTLCACNYDRNKDENDTYESLLLLRLLLALLYDGRVWNYHSIYELKSVGTLRPADYQYPLLV